MLPAPLNSFRESWYSPSADTLLYWAHGGPLAGASRAARRPEDARDLTMVMDRFHCGRQTRRTNAAAEPQAFVTVRKRKLNDVLSGGYAPRPPWLALRARYLIRSAKLNLTESDYARSAKFFLGALRYEFRKHFKATNDKIVPPTRPVWTPRSRASTDDDRRIFFFLF